MNEFIEKLIGRLEKSKKVLEEAALKEMNINGHTLDFENYNGAIGAVKCAITLVKNLAEEYNNGWILCSDRLPDFLDNVLVCTKSGGRTIAHLKHTPIEWRDMHMNKIDDVIAWKYLDAPYHPKGE